MTQEEKELLLKDLCARLPYHPKCVCYWKEKPQNGTDGYVTELTTYELDQFMDADKFDDIPIREIKPYLRLMSSMTEEEKEEKFQMWAWKSFDWEVVDWLNKHHFDYRELIRKGLALEAPEGMYNLDKK